MKNPSLKKIEGKFSVCLIPTQLPGIILYRMANFAEYMKVPVLMPKWEKTETQEQGWQHLVMEKKSKIMRDLEYICKNSDVIVFQRFLNPVGISIIQAIRQCSKGFKKVGMEMDDYMFNIPTYNSAYTTHLPGTPAWHLGLSQMQLSDFMIVSTNELARRYSKENSNIFVAENCIDLKWWGDIGNKNQNNKKIRIGWAGAGAHLEDCKILRNVMDILIAKYKDKIEFYFFSPNKLFDNKDGIINELGFFDLTKYPAKLKSLGFDIGIAPLCDNIFNRCKSANRFLEYSMLNIPTVASDIGGQFTEIIKNGKNGYLAQTEQDWIDNLSILIDDKVKRLKIGKTAFEFVNSNYRAEHGAKKYDAIMKKAFKVRDNYAAQRSGNICSETIKAKSGN